MATLIQSSKIVGSLAGVFLLASVLGFGCLALTSPTKAIISVEPSAIDTNAEKIIIRGSGFTPGSQVTMGFPDVAANEELPDLKGMWVTVVTTDQSGTFSTEVDLGETLWRAKPDEAGIYSVMAKNIREEMATTSLEVKKAAEKKKKKK